MTTFKINDLVYCEDTGCNYRIYKIENDRYYLYMVNVFGEQAFSNKYQYGNIVTKDEIKKINLKEN